MEKIVCLGLGLAVGVPVGMFYYRNMLKHNPLKLSNLMAQAEALRQRFKND